MFDSVIEEYLTEDEKNQIAKIKKALVFRKKERDDAWQKGFDRGIIVNQFQMVERMLEEGLDIKVVAKISGLSEKDVKRIKNDRS